MRQFVKYLARFLFSVDAELGMRFFAFVQMGMDLAQRSLYLAELVVGTRREIQIDMDKVNFQKIELMR